MNTLSIQNELPESDMRKFKAGEGAEEVLVPGAEAGTVAPGLEYQFFLFRYYLGFSYLLTQLINLLHYADTGPFTTRCVIRIMFAARCLFGKPRVERSFR